MAILIDGDGANNIGKIIEKAKAKKREVHIFCDTEHEIKNKYAIVHYVDKGADSADIAILNTAKEGDLVITNDSGLAAIILSKGIKATNSYGKFYTEENVNDALFNRYLRNTQPKIKRREKRRYGVRYAYALD